MNLKEPIKAKIRAAWWEFAKRARILQAVENKAKKSKEVMDFYRAYSNFATYKLRSGIYDAVGPKYSVDLFFDDIFKQPVGASIIEKLNRQVLLVGRQAKRSKALQISPWDNHGRLLEFVPNVDQAKEAETRLSALIKKRKRHDRKHRSSRS